MATDLTQPKLRTRFADALERTVLNPTREPQEPWSRREFATPLGIYLLSRLYVVSMFLAVSRVQHRTLTHLLTMWDSGWYLSIAQHGYVTSIPHTTGDAAQTNLGFFPLMPLVVRAVHFLTPLSWETSGIAASFLTGISASFAVWLLIRQGGTQSEARRAVSLVVFTPGALALSFVYSEGLIVTFACLCLWALRGRRWVLAGVAAAICSTADPVGNAAVIACILTALWSARDERSWRPLLAVVIAPLGVLTFFTYLYVHAGSFFAWFHAQRAGWQQGHYFMGAPRAIAGFITGGFSNMNAPVKTISLLLAILMVSLFIRIKPSRGIWLYSSTVIFMGLFSPVIGITPRLLLRGAPFLATVGARLNRRWFGVILATSCALLGFLIVISSTRIWTP